MNFVCVSCIISFASSVFSLSYSTLHT